MSEYKKKKFNKKPLKTRENFDNRNKEILMRSNKSKASGENFNIVKGTKKQSLFKILLLSSVAVFLVILLIIANVLYPIGIFEFLSSSYKVLGIGSSYSSKLSGSQITNCVRSNDYYYTITESNVNCYNNNGQLISTISHNYKKTVLISSKTRYLLFGQGEQNIRVCNFNKELNSISYDVPILCADIADNGNYAVVTDAKGYDSAVYVYNKNHKPIFEWYSSNGIINSVKLSQDGNSLFVSQIKPNNGEIDTYILQLKFDKVDAVKDFYFKNDIVLDLENISKKVLCVIFENTIKYINFDTSVVSEHHSEYSNNFSNNVFGKMLIVSNLSANEEKNIISLYNKKGICETSFSVSYSINDIMYKYNYFYILGGSSIYCLDMNGNLIYSIEVPLDTKYIVPSSQKQIIGISNLFMIKYELMKTRE